jgi:hypothetical protein
VSGFPLTPSSVSGPLAVAGVLSANGGTSTANEGGITAPAPVSGVAFTPSATQDTMIYIAANFTTVGTFKVTMGPTTGAENTPFPVANEVAASSDVAQMRVPAGWKVVATLTGVTVAFGTCLSIPC